MRQASRGMARSIALLRAVNVGGRTLSMADLRDLCAEIGWEDVRTYIQSGNLVFRAIATPGALEAQLEKAIQQRFGLEVPVFVRSASQWSAIVQFNPFPEIARDSPGSLHLLVSKRRPPADAAAKLMERAAAGERVEAGNGALWIHYPEGAGTS